MRILHIEQRFHPSYGYQVQQFARLHSSSHDITIITSDDFGRLKVIDKKEVFDVLDKEFEKEVGVRIIRLHTCIRWRDKVSLRKLKKTVLEIDPDVIYSHGVEGLPLMQLILSGIGCKYPIVTDSHDLPTATRNPALHWLFRLPLKLISIRYLNNSKSVCYYLDAAAKPMLVSYGIKKDNLKYLPLGVDSTVYYYCATGAKLIRQQLGITEDEKMIIYTGKIDQHKDPVLLLEAFLKLPEELQKLTKVVFVGQKNPIYDKTRLKPIQAKIGERFIYHNAVPFTMLKNFYSAADIGVFPQRNTLSSLDAQMCGLPLVMEKDATNSERLRYGGKVYIGGDLDDLAQTITTLLKNPNTLSRLSLGGKKYIRQKYDYKEIVASLEKDLEQLAKSGEI